MQMIYNNFHEFAEEHPELVAFFLDKEREIGRAHV